MRTNIYPVIAPKISYIHLNEKIALLVDSAEVRTKKINQIQSSIIDQCTGDKSLGEICSLICEKYGEEYRPDIIEQFVYKLTEFGYMHWSPVPVTIAKPERCDTNEMHDYFTPDSLHAITISITEECCFRCAHCSQNAGYMKRRFIPLDHVLRIAGEAKNLGARTLGLFGGEPMMYSGIEEIISYAYKIGYSDVKIFTKATLINLEKAKSLRSVGVRCIQVSCDSCDPEKYDQIVGKAGSFADFYQGMYNLLSVGIDIDLKIVVTKHNIAEIPEMIKYFSSSGVSQILIEVVVPVGRADKEIMPEECDIDELERYINSLNDAKTAGKQPKVYFNCLRYGKAKSCAGGIDGLIVFADGIVGPCDKWYSCRHHFNFGNVYEKSLHEIWNKGKFEIFRNVIDDERCNNCADLITCRGGCRLNSMLTYGDIKHPDEMCEKISGKNGELYINGVK